MRKLIQKVLKWRKVPLFPMFADLTVKEEWILFDKYVIFTTYK
ncbi:hypothetical protein HMPREF9700_01828 [Bergeyella zoohelcum CCUG 30536]|uniref:Uncharacterized protein n=1 Tax=Bergeyella zoohelcum TaxID=1015 RepID=A0A380ZV32_9FLAO|nr:hypothetical protein HMPREF9700_01828 [Bergeyella zoohelcum CCUG 30536]SUV53163.1 Uncharacterised protein [Bergeyella zoohelcum]